MLGLLQPSHVFRNVGSIISQIIVLFFLIFNYFYLKEGDTYRHRVWAGSLTPQMPMPTRPGWSQDPGPPWRPALGWLGLLPWALASAFLDACWQGAASDVARTQTQAFSRSLWGSQATPYYLTAYRSELKAYRVSLTFWISERIKQGGRGSKGSLLSICISNGLSPLPVGTLTILAATCLKRCDGEAVSWCL